MATFSAVSDQIRMLGNAQQNSVPILSQPPLTDWLVCQEVHGFEINTQNSRHVGTW